MLRFIRDVECIKAVHWQRSVLIPSVDIQSRMADVKNHDFWPMEYLGLDDERPFPSTYVCGTYVS